MKPLISIFTPIYNRETTIKRCYESLLNQTFKNFEWLVFNDGSNDNSNKVFREISANSSLKIRYFDNLQNKGKHFRHNEALNLAEGKFFLVLDSDDALLPNALEILLFHWERIPEVERHLFRGVRARSLNPITKQIVGKKMPKEIIDINARDLFFQKKWRGERAEMILTDILRKYPNPVNDDKIRFYPEAVPLYEMAKKYKDRCIDVPIRLYYMDTDNSLMKKNNNRSNANFYLWQYYVNDIFAFPFRYAFYSPVRFIKGYVGLWRDGFFSRRNFCQIINSCDRFYKRIISLCFLPIGLLLWARMKK